MYYIQVNYKGDPPGMPCYGCDERGEFTIILTNIMQKKEFWVKLLVQYLRPKGVESACRTFIMLY